jgi:ABC-2 type transport system permease protein
MMLMFTAAAALIREKDKGTIIRLRLSNMTTFEWLTSVSLTQLVIGAMALVATYLTAVALGYQSDGSLLALTIVGLLASLSMIGISILVAAYMRTIFDLLTIGCFPFFILMFFSGGMFPLPPIRIFTLGTHAVSINEILPTTHAITAMEKILNAGVGLNELGYELVAMTILTILYAALGVWLFTRRHMRATV